MPIAILRPSAVGTYDDWTLGAGASKEAAVDPGDPVTHDDDTSYISIPASPGGLTTQSFYLDTGLPLATIVAVNNVAFSTHARSNGSAGVANYVAFMRRASTDDGGSLDDPGSTYRTLAIDPYPRPGGGDWEPGDFGAGNIQGGVGVDFDEALAFRCTSMWAELDFVAPSGGYVLMLGCLLGQVFGAGLLLREAAQAARLVRGRLLLSPDEVRQAWRELREDRHPAWCRG